MNNRPMYNALKDTLPDSQFAFFIYKLDRTGLESAVQYLQQHHPILATQVLVRFKTLSSVDPSQHVQYFDAVIPVPDTTPVDDSDWED